MGRWPEVKNQTNQRPRPAMAGADDFRTHFKDTLGLCAIVSESLRHYRCVTRIPVLVSRIAVVRGLEKFRCRSLGTTPPALSTWPTSCLRFDLMHARTSQVSRLSMMKSQTGCFVSSGPSDPGCSCLRRREKLYD